MFIPNATTLSLIQLGKKLWTGTSCPVKDWWIASQFNPGNYRDASVCFSYQWFASVVFWDVFFQISNLADSSSNGFPSKHYLSLSLTVNKIHKLLPLEKMGWLYRMLLYNWFNIMFCKVLTGFVLMIVATCFPHIPEAERMEAVLESSCPAA